MTLAMIVMVFALGMRGSGGQSHELVSRAVRSWWCNGFASQLCGHVAAPLTLQSQARLSGLGRGVAARSNLAASSATTTVLLSTTSQY